MLVNRLKVYLSDLITPFQNVFVSGRLIQDNIMVAHEFFHHLKSIRNTNKVECTLKVVMQKAYDRVEWDFLLKSLEKRGFGAQWIAWMKVCITTPTNQVLINGCHTPQIRPTRGIRQGDPPSPYLFVLLADVLSKQVEKKLTKSVWNVLYWKGDSRSYITSSLQTKHFSLCKEQ